MQEVFNWLAVNYRLVIDGIIVIVALVLFIFRKRPVAAVLTAIYAYALEGVKLAEMSEMKGVNKLNIAVSYVEDQLKQCYPNLDVTRYVFYIRNAIESILETPQKKGEK